uniref:Synaptotagmin-like 2a n=1 Tax=Nothobranchius furzeri TaxID=105023 RepID=A0A8C6M0W3_NOTFU
MIMLRHLSQTQVESRNHQKLQQETTATMIDLSFLTEEEQESIRAVLKRDADLKRVEEKRIQNLQSTVADKRLLKYLTGEWFYKAKQHRHQDRIHGSDIIRASMRKTNKPLTLLNQATLCSEGPSHVEASSQDKNRVHQFRLTGEKASHEDVTFTEMDDPLGPKTLSGVRKNSNQQELRAEEPSPEHGFSSQAEHKSPLPKDNGTFRANLVLICEKTDGPSAGSDPGLRASGSKKGTVSPEPYSGGVEVQGTIQFAVNYIQKTGELQIFVVLCRGLVIADVKKNRSDPYVKCYLLPDKTRLGKRKSSVRKKTVNPTYNEILKFKVTMEELKKQNLNISVWHNDPLGRNSFLGEVGLDLSKWDFNNTELNEYILKSRVRSCLCVWCLHGYTHPPLPSGFSTDLSITVLPDMSQKSRQQTRVVKNTANPMFNHTMVYDGFQPEDLKETCVELTVWDHVRLKNHFVGGVRLGPGTGRSYGVEVAWMDSAANEVTLWHQMLRSNGEWVEDVLPLRMLVMAKRMSKSS